MRNLLNKVFMKKDCGDKAIVVEVGLAVIAVVLLVVFQGEMGTFIETMIGDMTTKISTILSTGVGAGV